MNPALLKQVLFIVSLASNCVAQVEASGTKNQSDSMVLVHGGTIQVGIDSTEIPRLQKIFDIHTEVAKHSVTLDDFYIVKYLVTNAQFKAFADANAEWRPGRIPPELDNGNYLRHWKTSAELSMRADHTIVNVNWYAAVAYCTGRAPTLPATGWTTSPVGTYPTNRYGL